jgi:hypothetical protein
MIVQESEHNEAVKYLLSAHQVPASFHGWLKAWSEEKYIIFEDNLGQIKRYPKRQIL